MHILVTNDDGVESPALWYLAKALRDIGLGEVTIIAPELEQSGMSMSFPPFEPNEIFPVEPPAPEFEGITAWGLSSTPVACVTAAIKEVVGPRPQLVASGINIGLNTGYNVMVSGTVGAAMAGAVWGIPSIAVSQGVGRGELSIDWTVPARIAARLAARIVELPPEKEYAPLINLNVPSPALGPLRGCLQTRLSGFFFGKIMAAGKLEPGLLRQRIIYTFDRALLPHDKILDTDDGALAAGYASVTPLAPIGMRPELDLSAVVEDLLAD